jgi:NAD(P)-dependent dehydrogenase (short-subunit alcohol dehydrogenase family)
MVDLCGKVVAITNGAKGLGADIAKAVSLLGADVVIAIRGGDACEKAIAAEAEIEASGRLASAVDVCGSPVQEASSAIVNRYGAFGRADVFIDVKTLASNHDENDGFREEAAADQLLRKVVLRCFGVDGGVFLRVTAEEGLSARAAVNASIRVIASCFWVEANGRCRSQAIHADRDAKGRHGPEQNAEKVVVFVSPDNTFWLSGEYFSGSRL